MKFLSLPLGLLLSLAFGSISCVHSHALNFKLSTQELVEHTGKSTVALVFTDTDNEDEETSDVKVYCSAVWIDDRHILTADHCVKAVQEKMQEAQDAKESAGHECSLLEKIFGHCEDQSGTHKVITELEVPMHFVLQNEVQAPGKDPTVIHLAKVVRVDSEDHYDLALLEVVGDVIPTHDNAELSNSPPNLGDLVEVVGHPKGLYWTFLRGSVAGYPRSLPHMKMPGPFLQIEAPVYFGNSGGGAFNEYGQLVGIADFLLRLPGEGFFVPAESIKVFLNSPEADKK